ncbi:MAG: transporter ATP-binding protein [Clostridia bacterium]|jgi:branched-chain amino acid transport system ATP-binding protein|nr:transporter ATP-binding protein [Clostridia bacterium]
MPIIKVNNLSKSFGGVKAVSNINMTIDGGEIIGVIGPNGAGKTTFFNLLTGIYSPSSGEVVYNLDKEISSKSFKPYKMTGYGVARTFQNIRLFKNMSILDNVLLGYHNNMRYGLLSSLFRLPSFYKNESKAYEEVLKLLEIFNLLDKKDELASSLPYGEQRKVEIARALAAKPKLLLLDEPAAGMNPNETKELTALINWIKDEFKLTIILIEHDMSLVMGICSKVFVFDYGTLIASGTPNEVQNNEQVIKAYLGGE